MRPLAQLPVQKNRGEKGMALYKKLEKCSTLYILM
jgi:hypothetical protein